jgi:hypothetical protein
MLAARAAGMPRPEIRMEPTSLSPLARILAGAAIFIAGVALFIARPGTALAHHLVVAEEVDCEGWSVQGEYVGGEGDRLVVVDVVINGESIEESFYFDNAPGSLGHQSYWLLFERAGDEPSLITSGTVTMYEKQGGQYTRAAQTETLGTDVTLTCEGTPTSTATSPSTQASPTSTPTAVATATATSTPVEATPTSTSTPSSAIQGTVTPEATPTPPSQRARTSTPVPPSGGTSGGTTPDATPTYTDEVLGGPPVEGGPSTGATPPSGVASPRLPNAGAGSENAAGLLAGVIGMLIAAAGLAVVATGLRSARSPQL